MGLTIGPSSWWYASLVRQCPLGTQLLDGSRITCKANGVAWIVAPSNTQVSMQWASGTYNGIDAPPTGFPSEICRVAEWTTLCTALVSRGFNPCDWFVPNISQLQTAGYACRFFWDSVSATSYWSSTENSAAGGCAVGFSNGITVSASKLNSYCVRAFRCVTY